MNDNAAPGAPSGPLFAAIQQRLREAKEPHVSWHDVLNSHASKRPEEALGGPLCASVKACKEFGRFGSMHTCRIVLPNSYALGDGKVVEAEATAPDKRTAEEDAGCAVFARLCADRDGLPNVIFRPAHWNVPPEALIADIGRVLDPLRTSQPLAVRQRAAASGAGVAEGLQNVPEANLHRATDLIHLCLRAHDGSVDPTKINHHKIAQVAGRQERVHALSAPGRASNNGEFEAVH